MSVELQLEEDFTLTELNNDIFLCREKYYWEWNTANLWVVKGSSMDLVIDTGVGLWDLPGFLKGKGVIGDKPYQAVATHIHFDHSGGLHQFQEFAIHRSEGTAIQTGDRYETGAFMKKSHCSKPPSKDWSAKNYSVSAAEPTRLLDDGDIFDLGNRKLRVLHLPGHSRGSIALHEEETRTLFTGDVMYDGPLLEWLPFSDLSHNIQSIETLRDLAPSVDRVCPGHRDCFDGDKMKQLASNYLSKVGKCYGVGVGCLKATTTVLLKGRNTDNIPAKCCFFSCCCCLCL
jgi:glyoxylase-like metal-dependent hydrolase (beta-lactamase superfamily II)